MGGEGDRMDFTIISLDQEYCSKCIVGSVCFKDDWFVGYPMHKNVHRGESLFQSFERFLTVFREDVRSVLSGEASERNDDVGVVGDEPSIEICKPEEALDSFD